MALDSVANSNAFSQIPSNTGVTRSANESTQIESSVHHLLSQTINGKYLFQHYEMLSLDLDIIPQRLRERLLEELPLFLRRYA